MYKILLTDISFIIAASALIVAFITAKTYAQLGVAILVYPLLTFFAYKAFPQLWRYPAKKLEAAVQPMITAVRKVEDIRKEHAGIADMDKRLFLKLIGATGLSFFLISLFGRRIETLLFGQNLITQPAPAGKTTIATASPTDGYTISEIDDGIIGYYGFINKEGAWFVMKRDTDNGTFRYAKGELDFPKNWKNRHNLKYDYFYNVFVY